MWKELHWWRTHAPEFDVFSLIQRKVAMQVGPRPGCSPGYPLQALDPKKRSARCTDSVSQVPGSAGFCLASIWLETDSKEEKNISPSSSSLFETFLSARSFSGVSAPTAWHWHQCGVTAAKFSHLPQAGGWWCHVQFLGSRSSMWSIFMPWSFFFFFPHRFWTLTERHIIYRTLIFLLIHSLFLENPQGGQAPF